MRTRFEQSTCHLSFEASMALTILDATLNIHSLWTYSYGPDMNIEYLHLELF